MILEEASLLCAFYEKRSVSTLNNPELLNNPQLLRQAAQEKKRRFVPRGIITLIIGILLLVIGLLLNTGVRSLEGVLVGVGILVIIIGIIIVLIGLIKPITPSQVNPNP
jgi:hypothetical protein